MKKLKLAAGRLAGKTQKEQAFDAGCSISSVSHAGKDPEVQSLMRQMAEAHRAQLAELYGRMLEGIGKDLDAPSLPARQNVRAELSHVIAVADGVTQPQSKSEQGGFTLTELLVAYRHASSNRPEEP